MSLAVRPEQVVAGREPTVLRSRTTSVLGSAEVVAAGVAGRAFPAMPAMVVMAAGLAVVVVAAAVVSMMSAIPEPAVMALMALAKQLRFSDRWSESMAKYALIDTRANRVANVLVWDGITPFLPPAHYVLRLVRPDERVAPGFGYDPVTDTFIEPPPEPEPPEPEPEEG